MNCTNVTIVAIQSKQPPMAIFIILMIMFKPFLEKVIWYLVPSASWPQKHTACTTQCTH